MLPGASNLHGRSRSKRREDHEFGTGFSDGQLRGAPGESDDCAGAVLNRPLTSGDRLWLDPDARGELEMGSASLHLDHGTVFGLEQLDDAVMQMSLTEGAASIRVRAQTASHNRNQDAEAARAISSRDDGVSTPHWIFTAPQLSLATVAGRAAG